MTVAILGASGFVGRNLVSHLLYSTDYKILAISRRTESIQVPQKYRQRLKTVSCDIFDETALLKNLQGVETVYYLIHSLGGYHNDFHEKDEQAANIFCRIAKQCRIKKVIYVGALGAANEKLSLHLSSRQSVGLILRQNLANVVEFRASIIIGLSSLSFEIIRTLVDKLSFMILPGWANTRIQPIGLGDCLAYLAAALDNSFDKNEIIEIGGPEVMSYQQLLSRYAGFSHKRLLIVVIPFLPKWPGSIWLRLFVPNNLYTTGRAMIASLSNDMVVTDHSADKFFPEIKPAGIEESF